MTELVHWIRLASPLSAQLLLAGIWQGLLLTLLAGLSLKLCPSVAARTRFLFWTAVFFLLVLLPALPAALAAMHSAIPARGSMESGTSASSPLHLEASWAFALDGIWASACFLSLFLFLRNLWQLRILAKQSIAVNPDSYASELQSILTPAHARPVRICLSDKLDSPSALGFLRPAILIPDWLWSKLTPSELKQIVLHELAHLRRGDDWSNLLQKLLRVLCPLNPALFWVERRLCIEREMACDDAVLNASGNPREYAACLTKIAEAKLLRRSLSLAPGVWKNPSELASRVHRILERRPKARPLLSRAMVAASFAVYLGGALMLAQCPQMVSFAPSSKPPLPVRARLQPASVPPSAKKILAAIALKPGNPSFKAVNLEPRTDGVRLRRALSTEESESRVSVQYLRLDETSNGENSWFVFTIWDDAPTQPAVSLEDGNLASPQYLTFPDVHRWILIQI